MTWIALALSLGGNVGVVLRARWGFGCWIVANALWIADAAGRRDAPQLALWTVYLALAAWGWMRWKEAE